MSRVFQNFVAPHGFWLFVRITGAVIGVAVEIFLAYVILEVVDKANAGDREGLKAAFFVMAETVVAGILSSLLNRYASGRLGTLTVKTMRSMVANHVPDLTVSWMDSRNSGEEVSKVTTSMATIQNYIENDLPNIIFQPLRFVCAFVYMLFINYKMLLACVVMIPVMMIIAQAISNPIQKLSEALQKKTAVTNSMIQDALGGMQISRAYNLKDLLLQKFGLAVDNMLTDSLAIEKRRSMLTPLIVLTQMIPFSLCFAYGGYLSIQGQLTTGGLIAFIQLMNYIVQPAIYIPRLLANRQNAAGAASHIFELLDAPPERKSGVVEGPKDFDAAVRFSNVSFGYNEENGIVKNVNFTLPEKSLTALVGHSGSGKSTLLKLINGFYEPSEGQIEILGTNTMQWDLEKLRTKIAVVSQDCYLFPVSIAENIAYGKPDASRDEIIQAAKAASAHDFIIALPDGYETVVGERGTGLSGGQRQRISIARALIQSCPILLFDEPSSALDQETERYIQEELKRLSANHTLLVSAHRLSITREADRIIVLDKGKIAGIGTHETLMQENEIYRELVMKQDTHTDEEKEVVA